MSAASTRRLPSLHAAGLPVAAVGTSFLGGVVLAWSPSLGIGLVIALVYAPLVLLNLPLGLALWVPLIFVENLDVVSVGPLAATLLILAVWFGTLRAKGSATVALLRANARLLGLIAVFLVWLTLTLAWARNESLVLDVLGQWAIAALVFLVVSTAFTSKRGVELVAIAFVAGAVLTVVIGLVANDFSSAKTAAQVAVDQGSRVQGGSGDPNDLAAGLVPALILGGGLAVGTRSSLGRFLLLPALVVIAVGFAAAESRGALVASVVALGAAFVFYRGRRAYVVVFLALIVAAAAVWFSIFPDAWHRITTFNNEGNGREDFWRVALRIWQDHAVAGVGLNNYLEVSPDYVRSPGPLKFVELIAERPHVAHNTYLQLMAETGLVGLTLFISVVVGSLRCAWLAAKRFDLLGDSRFAGLARAVLVAGISMLSTSFFLTNGADKRMWVLLALGPALLSVSRRSEPPPRAPRAPAPGPMRPLTARRRGLLDA